MTKWRATQATQILTRLITAKLKLADPATARTHQRSPSRKLTQPIPRFTRHTATRPMAPITAKTIRPTRLEAPAAQFGQVETMSMDMEISLTIPAHTMATRPPTHQPTQPPTHYTQVPQPTQAPTPQPTRPATHSQLPPIRRPITRLRLQLRRPARHPTVCQLNKVPKS